MGKGKKKGWRPPAADDPAAGALVGSVSHLSGDTVASPVTLRDEGRAIPVGHPLYGQEDEKGKGKGKAAGGWMCTKCGDSQFAKNIQCRLCGAPKPSGTAADGNGDTAGTGANAVQVAEKPKGSAVAAKAQKPSAPKPLPETKTAPVKRQWVDPRTEIERRRAAMAEARGQPVPAAEPQPGEEEALGDESAEVAAETGEDQGEALAEAAADDVVAVEAEATDAVEDGDDDDDEEGPPPKQQRTDDGGAIKQGLQGWAERVNALATEDPSLITKCRDFVRRRILKAHADGNLHSVDWVAEPLPTAESLQEDA